MIRFQCTCGKPLKVDDSVAGRSATCPHCGSKVRVPAGHGTSRTRARDAEPEPTSGPAALQAALRDARGRAGADDIPTAEVVAGPAPRTPPPSPETDQAVKGLDALARAAAPAPAGPKARGRNRKAARTPAPSALPNGRPPAVAEHSRKAAIIGAVAAVVVLILALIAASFIGGDEAEPEKPVGKAPPTETVLEQPKRKFAFDQPGALFGDVGEVDENDDDASGRP